MQVLFYLVMGKYGYFPFFSVIILISGLAYNFLVSYNNLRCLKISNKKRPIRL